MGMPCPRISRPVMEYRFNTHQSVKVFWPANIKERDANPDGFARDFLGQLAYEVRFKNQFILSL